ncbi:MAG TPA: SAM-dependent chlorinase/fluorinase [Alphaproteobacteria bacterium]
MAAMIYLFTDFGGNGPYVGQVKAVLAAAAPGVPVIDLAHDAPVFEHKASAYLLAALADRLPAAGVVLGVVDPGVGRTDRRPVVVRAGRFWYVGPDNGLFAVAAKHAGDAAWWQITWRPERLSSTFHGRDLFAPVAAMLARGEDVPGRPIAAEGAAGMGWPDDLGEVIYLDHYGNAMTGIRASTLPDDAILKIGDVRVQRARTFAEVGLGQAIWYENSCGLVEVAMNRANAAAVMRLTVGDHVLAIALT